MNISHNMIRLITVFLGLITFVAPSIAKEYVLKIGQFEKFKVNSNVSVVYKNLPDSTGYAVFEAPDGKEELYNLTIKNGNLNIRLTDTQWGNEDQPVLYVYSDYLSGVESYSNRIVTVESVAPGYSFNATQIGNGTIIVEGLECTNVSAAIKTGNGTVSLSGKCESANFQMLGAGLISADRLEANNVKCSILGTGSIGCWALNELNVKGLGTTKIYYKGHPQIKKSGGGKLMELPE